MSARPGADPRAALDVHQAAAMQLRAAVVAVTDLIGCPDSMLGDRYEQREALRSANAALTAVLCSQLELDTHLAAST
jgi:hypothetical protein